MSTLSLIEISNGKIDIDKALEFLEKMGLEKLEHKDKNEKNEKYWESLVRNDFQKQLYVLTSLFIIYYFGGEKVYVNLFRYIKSAKESGQGKDVTFISAGFRANVEIGRINVNKYIAKVCTFILSLTFFFF